MFQSLKKTIFENWFDFTTKNIHIFNSTSTHHKSKVKGTLELYHAYISDSPNGATENEEGESADSGGWELVDQPTPTSNHSPEDTAEVQTF